MKINLLILSALIAFSACSDSGNKNTGISTLATSVSKSKTADSSSDEQILAAKLDKIRYQTHMLNAQNAKPLAHEVKMEYIAEANTLILYFPENEPAPVGKVTFLHPTKTAKNHIFELKTDPSKRMFILLDNLEKGVWRVKVEWQGEDKIYTQEESINIEPNDWARPIHK